MAKNADAKRMKILEAAKRRFAHFGLAKTTMAEIAQDLSFSKALLYYYFPDKNRLYASVFEMAVDEIITETTAKIEDANGVCQAMDAFLSTRLQIIKDNYSIFEYAYSLRSELPPDVEEVLPKLFEKEIQQVSTILRKGIKHDGLVVDDVEVTAKILLISLLGMRLGILQEVKSLFLPPSKEEFDYILGLQQKLAKIFLNGLKS
ncbi:TetR/AcrR family transcriptional regulator [Sphingobacterium lactis]|uniref:DNA-binding transcriptional regulator, AcrR family n=1 Tax=Sphingobacterium lactis TaxID=797291 RepID=A0A1H6B3Q2_9SPHI|nr:TetR/AcrR family transcriptional regulator [Sphingobacterium lactis]SEG55471.1 DNA-binding transcriptional regulator, AcrR family [Sphingobacterium lactis]